MSSVYSKILVALFCMMSLINLASAINWDNRLDYSNNDLKVTFVNGFGFGKDLGSVTLKSHQTPTEVRNVIFGKDRVPMYYDFEGWTSEEDLGKVYFTNERNGKEIEKKYTFVQAIYEEVDKDDYEINCSYEWFENVSQELEVCKRIKTGEHTEEVLKGWKPLTENKVKNARIGIMVDVEKGEYVDAVWTIAGKKVDKHGAWADSYNVGLLAYYNMSSLKNELTGGDDLIPNNATLTFGTDNCLVGACVQLDGVDEDDGFWIPQSLGFNWTLNYTIVMGFYSNATSGSDTLTDNNDSGGSFQRPYANLEIAESDLYVADMTGAGVWDAQGDVIIGSHATIGFTQDTTNNNRSLWYNKSLLQSGTTGAAQFDNNKIIFAQSFDNNNEFSGTISFIAIWGRPLSDEEMLAVLDVSDVIYYEITSLPVTIDYPLNNSVYGSSQNLLNYSISNAVTCSWTDDNFLTNNSVTCGVNVTTATSIEGNNVWGVCGINGGGTENCTTSSFVVDSFVGNMSAIYPTNTTYNVNVTDGNYTFEDANPSRAWYSLDNGINNLSEQDSGTNFTNLVTIEGSNELMMCGNDTAGRINCSFTSFFKDTITGEGNITYPENTTYSELQNLMNYSIDELNLQSCIATNITTNITLTCGENVTTLGSIEGANEWRVIFNDTSGNENFSSVIFTVNTEPNITFKSPTIGDGDNQTSTSIWATVDVTEEYFSNLTFNLYNSSSLYNSTFYDGAERFVNWTDLPEGTYLLNATVWTTTGNSNSTLTRTVTVDPDPPDINFTGPIYIVPLQIRWDNFTFNWTVEDTRLDACKIDYNGTEEIVVAYQNYTDVNVSDYDNRIVNLSCNDTFGNEASSVLAWNYSVWEINQSFSEETTEGNLENFLSLVRVHSSLSVSQVNLIYNETENVGESFIVGNETYLRKNSLLIPAVTSYANLTFFFSIEFSDGSQINISANNQSIINLDIDDCSSYSNQIINFTLLGEETKLQLDNTSMEISVNILSSDRSSSIMNVSDLYTDNPVDFCINFNLTNSSMYALDSVAKYTSTDSAVEYYNIVNYTLDSNSTLQNIFLYALNSSDSTEFRLTFTGTDFLPSEDALVYVYRQYVKDNDFKVVELPKTDSNGQTVLHLVRNDVVYNFIIIKDGEILGNFENLNAFCEDYTIGDCQINLNALDSEEEIFDYDSSIGILYSSPSFDNDSRQVSFDFLTDDGSSKTVSMEVIRVDTFGNRSICNDSLVSSGGTLVCTVAESYDESSLRVNVFVDGVQAVFDTIKLDRSNFGNAGYLVYFVMVISFILLFMESKTGVLVGIGLGVAAGIGLNLTSGSLIGAGASGIFMVVVIIIGIYKLNKRRDP